MRQNHESCCGMSAIYVKNIKSIARLCLVGSKNISIMRLGQLEKYENLLFNLRNKTYTDQKQTLEIVILHFFNSKIRKTENRFHLLNERVEISEK